MAFTHRSKYDSPQYNRKSCFLETSTLTREEDRLFGSVVKKNLTGSQEPGLTRIGLAMSRVATPSLTLQLVGVECNVE